MNTAMRGAGLALSTMIAAGSLTAFATPAQAKDHGGGDDRVEARGACIGGGHWKLKAKHDDGRIEYEFEVDTNKVGKRWTVKASDNGHPNLLRPPDHQGAAAGRSRWRRRPGTGPEQTHQAQSDPWIEGMFRQGESVDPKATAMKRALLMIIGSMLAVVPFALGMVGNTSLTRQVPVRVPAQAKAAEPRAEPTPATKATPEAIKPTERITAKPVPTPSETRRNRGVRRRPRRVRIGPSRSGPRERRRLVRPR